MGSESVRNPLTRRSGCRRGPSLAHTWQIADTPLTRRSGVYRAGIGLDLCWVFAEIKIS